MFDTGAIHNHQMQDLVSRLRNLHSLYTHLTMAYLRLPLSCRRYLYGGGDDSTYQVRMLAEAKFILAATLQWTPSNHRYDTDAFATATGRVQQKTSELGEQADDELCPIWIDFFKDFYEADRLLASGEGVNTSASAAPMYGQQLLLQLEQKYLWIQALVHLVAEKGQFVWSPGGVELTESMTFLGWNRFCLRVARGMSLEDALSTIREPEAFRVPGAVDTNIVHSGTNRHREYFAFAMHAAHQPWVPIPHNSSAVFQPDRVSDSPGGRSTQFCHSYPAAFQSVEEAAAAGQLCTRVVCAEQPVSPNPIPIQPTSVMQWYNSSWDRLTDVDDSILWPTPSFQLDDIQNKSGLPLAEHVKDQLSSYAVVVLKAKSFFLSGLQVPYDIGTLPVKGSVLVPRSTAFDADRIEALLQQMLVERVRWDAESLSRRTGIPGYVQPALGNDWMSRAIQEAVEGLIEHNLETLAKAGRE